MTEKEMLERICIYGTILSFNEEEHRLFMQELKKASQEKKGGEQHG